MCDRRTIRVSLKIRLRFLKCYVWSTLFYARCGVFEEYYEFPALAEQLNKRNNEEKEARIKEPCNSCREILSSSNNKSWENQMQERGVKEKNVLEPEYQTIDRSDVCPHCTRPREVQG
ncbi:hypothetical protein J437_LFUL006348, partial [Ladona fulva]